MKFAVPHCSLVRILDRSRMFLIGLCLTLCVAQLPAFGQLVPGDLTDPAVPEQKKVEPAIYQTPEHLQFPYIATYYVKPTVTTSEEIEIKYFVTDWNNSLYRNGDNSARFSAQLTYSSDLKTWKTLSAEKLPGGDHSFKLGKLVAGDYTLSIACQDAKGRPSHVVWHEFRARNADDLEISEDKTYRMAPSDLSKYQISNEGNLGRVISVEVGDVSALQGAELSDSIAKSLADTAKTANVPPRGYLIFAAAQGGKLMQSGAVRSRVVYGDKYDKEQVAATATRTSQGLQKMVDDAAAAGIQKFVILPGTYRVGGTDKLSLPGNFTLDLNGATLKMNEFVGDKGAVVEIRNQRDSHLVNGIIEGDYYEHDYANSPSNSEWVLGVVMNGDCRYCSFDNLTVKNITGYGVANGLADYDQAFPGMVELSGNGTAWEPGAIQSDDGTVNAAVSHVFTSGFHDILAFKNKYLSVSAYLGYQGIRTKSWNYTAAFYDQDQKFISASPAFQYRVVLIPDNAAFLRISIEEESLENATNCGMSAQLFKMPWNCAFRNLVIERCRGVGMAPAAMRNMLIEDCDFSYSGETLATCAFDAEDGWDMMQDVYIHRNTFHDNPNNELLTCAGHNFIIEDNDCSIYLWDRTNSPCVRNNRFRNASFGCQQRCRTMHGRYEDNTYRDLLGLGSAEKPTGWDIVVTVKIASAAPEKHITVGVSYTGRIRDGIIENAEVVGNNFENTTFHKSHFVLTTTAVTWKGLAFDDCFFQHLNMTNVISDCRFDNCRVVAMNGGNLTMENCAINNLTLEPYYWDMPNRFLIRECTINNVNKPFIRTPIYSIADFTIEKCVFKTGESPVLDIYDLRAQATDDQSASVTFKACKMANTFGKVMNVSDTTLPGTKSLAIRAEGNTLAEGVTVIDPAQTRKLWTLEQK